MAFGWQLRGFNAAALVHNYYNMIPVVMHTGLCCVWSGFAVSYLLRLHNSCIYFIIKEFVCNFLNFYPLYFVWVSGLCGAEADLFLCLHKVKVYHRFEWVYSVFYTVLNVLNDFSDAQPQHHNLWLLHVMWCDTHFSLCTGSNRKLSAISFI